MLSRRSSKLYLTFKHKYVLTRVVYITSFQRDNVSHLQYPKYYLRVANRKEDGLKVMVQTRNY